MSADVVVIGAGITGAAAALELAAEGLRVVLLDRWGPAAMGSGWTLGGVRQSGRHPAELPLAQAAVRLWETMSDRLDADVFYRQHGNLRLARTEAEALAMQALAAEQSRAGLEIHFITGSAIQEIAPAVARTVLAACWCPSDGHAEPVASVRAMVAAGKRLGVAARFGERAVAIEVEGGFVRAVRTEAGRIACARVVVAAGVFGNELLTPLGVTVPLEVSCVAVMRTAPVAAELRPVIGVANADVAGRQQVDGSLRATTGMGLHGGLLAERDGRPHLPPTAAALAGIVERFGRVVPCLRDAPVEQVWAGLIDKTPDALPVLDGVAGVAGLVVGMGFSGHGFCLGPVSGRILADLVMGRAPAFELGAFTLGRFAAAVAPAELSLHG